MSQSAVKKAGSDSTLGEGSPAPDFTLPADDNTTVALSGLRGKTVVLYFYPKDSTPGCTVEAHDFTRLLPEFAKAGAVVFGVSKDSVNSHQKFKEKECIAFPLVADVDTTLCQAYGVLVDKNMYGRSYKGIERSTFLIDGEGIIRRIWRKVKVDNHAQEVLDAVRTL